MFPSVPALGWNRKCGDSCRPSRSGHSKSLLEEIGRKEAELHGITDKLISATPASIESRVGEIRAFVANGLGDLRDLLRKNAALARTDLLKHSS
jgi:hypothetical protein